jgi:hypothetical protein
MTSPKQVAANRINGRKGRGPRTGAGKARASRNARRHGLASFSASGDPAIAEQVEQIADAICAGDHNPLLRQQAVMIAENQLWLSYVRAEKLFRMEPLRHSAATAGDLVRLLRYEQRAWSQRKRAVRAFMAIKLSNFLGPP